MLPGGFKKDSRVWLHKNSSTFPKKMSPFSKCDGEGKRVGSDDPYRCLPQDQYFNSDPIITDVSGRIYKKDSRTWLHKSSKKKKKGHRSSDPLEERGSRLGWRPEVHGMCAGEAPEGVTRTQSSTELIRTQAGATKVKKKMTMVLMSMMVTPATGCRGVAAKPEARQQLSLPKFRVSAKRASHHDISGTGKGCTAVSAFSSDPCVTYKDKSPSSFALQNQPPDSDNDNDKNNTDLGEDDENDSEDDDDDEEMEDLSVHAGQQRGVPWRSGGGGVQMPNWTHSTVEVTRDGLRELERMMKEQTQRRSALLAKPLLDRPGQTPRCDVSPESQSSDSRVSLDANVNLSEEVMSGQELNQSSNSAEQQLTRATAYLQVCSPQRQTTKRSSSGSKTKQT